MTTNLNSKYYTVDFRISNFKSYFDDPISFHIRKPITIIAGPNGEGKSNLLEALLVGTSNFLKHSKKFRNTGFFTKSIQTSSRPEINTSLYELVFSNIMARDFSGKSYPERLDPKNIVSRGKRKSSVNIRIERYSEKSQRKLVEMMTTITKNPPFIQDSGYINKIGDLEFIYLNSDSILNDLFVKLVGQEFSHQLTSIPGTARKAEYSSNILKIFSKDEDRLICDIDDGKFEEKYLKDMNLFLTSNLATGAKKECILYLFGILAEKLKNEQDWLALFLVDEIESGLHVSRQKTMVDALIGAFTNNEKLSKHVKIVMTTHSPIIYSELMKYPDYVDTYFVLRNPTESSKVYNYDDVVGDELKAKRILAELGLNIYDLPKTVLFVEGKTDKEFWSQILKDVAIIPLRGASIPNVISDLIETFPIARSKEYHVVVDRSAYDKIIKDIEELKRRSVTINGNHIKYNSIEEFLFDIKIGDGDPINVWNKIEKKISTYRDKLSESEMELLNINIEKVRENVEKKGNLGINEFINGLKNKDEFYKILGKNWTILLEKNTQALIEKIKSSIES